MLVGCGNVGSRHLQAIAKLRFPTSVDIVEPNQSALLVAKSRLAEIPLGDEKTEFYWHESIDKVRQQSSLAVIATTSIGRKDIISQLLKKGHSRFLIEKMVCQSADEYEMLLSEVKDSRARAWINTPRRYYESYNEIRKFFANREISCLSVTAGDLGLGSNAIHFIDLFLWLCNEKKLVLNGDFLFDQLLPNKRGKEFLEFAGSIFGQGASKHSMLSITFIPFSDNPLVLNIASKDMQIIVDETNEKVWQIRTKDNSKILSSKNEYLSDLGTKIMTDILDKDECLLPSLADSLIPHSELFRIFNSLIRKLTSRAPGLCPIT